MNKYLCQGCEFNILGWCKKYNIYGLKSKKIKECEGFKKEGIQQMQKRICPNCFTKWFSSDSSSVWVCENCGHAIPVPDQKEIQEEDSNEAN